MANLSQGVPQFSSPFTDQNGQIVIVWYQFLINLFNRTGGSSGANFAPGDGTYVVAAAEAGLNNANIASNTPTISWDFSTLNQAKLNVSLNAIVIPESQVTNLVSDLAARALITTQILAGLGLTGGGSLAANRTISIDPIPATAALNPFTSLLQGLVPASAGGTVNYLRADATFHDPLSGGLTGSVTLAKLTTGGSNGSISYVKGLITAVTAPT